MIARSAIRHDYIVLNADIKKCCLCGMPHKRQERGLKNVGI